MRFQKSLCLFSVFLGLAPLQAGGPVGEPGKSYDVLVYGGTPGGICAALAAAREGLQTVLVEPGGHLGGMISGGLNATDFKKTGAIGGIEKEYYQRVAGYYSDKYGPQSSQLAASAYSRKEGDGNVFVFPGIKAEPHVAEQIFDEMVKAEKTLTVLKGLTLEAVSVVDGRIGDVKFKETKDAAGTPAGPQTTIEAKEYIDASYCGDLMAAAGASFRIGIESKKEYGESLASGSPSDEVQAFSYRITLTSNPENRIPVTKPENYNPDYLDFEHSVNVKFPEKYAASLKRARTAPPQFNHWNVLPNQKFDANLAPFHGGNVGYVTGNRAKREEIEQAHKNFYLAYLYFLQTDERISPEARREFQQWGLCEDEFADSGHFPNQLYIREGRRLVGEYVMTQSDIETNRHKSDSICIGDYSFDSKGTQVTRDKNGNFTWEHSFEKHLTSAYEVPYGALVPKVSEISNLLVPVCLSSSQVAWSSLRMEPVFMRAGQVAGVAAALAIRENVPVQKVPVDKLQTMLRNAGAVLSLEAVETQEPTTP